MWNLEKFGAKDALIDEYGARLTYAQLKTETEKLVTAVGRRCFVFLLSTNSIGSLMGYAAFINGQIVPVLLNAQMDSSLIDKLLSAYCPAYLWAPEELADQFEAFNPVYSVLGYCLLKTNYEKSYPLHDDLALLLTTSGSTGSPKLVRQSYENIRSNAESIVKYLELDPSERPITTLPMNYTYGLSIINSHLMVGATLLVTDKSFTQREFWDFLKKAEATSFGGVPYTYEMLDKMRFQRMDIPAFKTMTQAGGKLTPELHEKFAQYAAETGKQFIVMYGQCEATARMGYLPADMAIRKKGSMGIAIPGGKFRLIDMDGKEINEPYVTGELVYEGKNVTLGYA